jgi:hypothetical protein
LSNCAAVIPMCVFALCIGATPAICRAGTEVAQGSSVAGCVLPDPAKSETNLCGQTLAPLCRSGHAQRRLSNKQILIVGGTFSNGPACPVLFDPKSETLKMTDGYPGGGDFVSALGFKLDDNRLAFTNRTHLIDPNDFTNEYKNLPQDRLIFWDVAANAWSKIDSAPKKRMEQASVPLALRRKESSEIVHFIGEFDQTLCASLDDEVNGIHCGRTVRIRVSGAKDYGVLRRKRIQFDATGFADGRIFVAGGKEIGAGKKNGESEEFVGDGPPGMQVAETAEFYVPAKAQWFETPPLPEPVAQARTFGISEKEVLVVDVVNGRAWIWSSDTNSWKDGFNTGKAISRAIMHSQGKLVATMEGKASGTEDLLIWNPAKKTKELVTSPLPFTAGTGLVELDDQRVLETQPSGALIWDIKKKTSSRLKK